MSAARGKAPEGLARLTRSELERVIHETPLHRDDALVATMFLVDKAPQIEIAAELGWERKTVSRRLPSILVQVERTARHLYA